MKTIFLTEETILIWRYLWTIVDFLKYACNIKAGKIYGSEDQFNLLTYSTLIKQDQGKKP